MGTLLLLLLPAAALCASAADPARVGMLNAPLCGTFANGFGLWPLVGAVLFCLLQAALIIGLLVNRTKRLQGEAEASLIADISSKFVNLPPGEVDREIMEAERRICEFLDLDISAIWQWSAGHPGHFTLTHYFSAQDGPQPSMQLSESDFPWFRQIMLEGRVVPISSLDDMPAEAALDRENARRLGIKSNLCIPLMVGGEPVGILGLNTTRAERRWPDALVKRLQLVAQIFANALARKHADHALRESEERMTLAAEAAQFGVWMWSAAHNEVWGSDRWMYLFGFAAGDNVSFERVLERIHPDDRESVEREVRHALVGKVDYVGEFRTLLPDGTQRWIASRGRWHADSSRTLDRMLGAAIDITERKRTEEAFRTSQARLAAGAELAGLGYYEVDFGERAIFIDEWFHEICGVPAGHQQGLESLEFWMEHLHPDDRQLMLDERENLHDGRIDKLSIEYRYLHPTAGLKWIHHLAGVATRNATGRALRTYGVVRDVTQQRLVEMEARELRSNLAHAGRVTLLGQLASALAHELSQPLGAILRNAEAAEIMLEASAPDLEELRAIVKDILSDDARASHVIERLRSLLKRRSVDTQPLDLQGVIAEVLALVHADAAARHMKIAFPATPDLPRVLGDRVHLQQVLLNLLVNAMDALDAVTPSQRTIQVSARRVDPYTVEVRVADNGPGIPGESLERLFEPFFTTKPSGMGMGLPVSKTIIEAHRGKLWAENGSECGACFCFTVPVAGGEGK